MSRKLSLLAGFLFCGLMQQSVFSGYRPTSFLYNDKKACELLRREIFAILHQQRCPLQNSPVHSSQLPVDTYRYVMASIAMFEALKCSRFEHTF